MFVSNYKRGTLTDLTNTDFLETAGQSLSPSATIKAIIILSGTILLLALYHHKRGLSSDQIKQVADPTAGQCSAGMPIQWVGNVVAKEFIITNATSFEASTSGLRRRVVEFQCETLNEIDGQESEWLPLDSHAHKNEMQQHDAGADSETESDVNLRNEHSSGLQSLLPIADSPSSNMNDAIDSSLEGLEMNDASIKALSIKNLAEISSALNAPQELHESQLLAQLTHDEIHSQQRIGSEGHRTPFDSEESREHKDQLHNSSDCSCDCNHQLLDSTLHRSSGRKPPFPPSIRRSRRLQEMYIALRTSCDV